MQWLVVTAIAIILRIPNVQQQQRDYVKEKKNRSERMKQFDNLTAKCARNQKNFEPPTENII